MPLFSRLAQRFTRNRALAAPVPVVSRADRALRLPDAPGALPPALVDEMSRDAMIQTALTVKRLGVLAARGGLTDDGTPEGRRRRAFVEGVFDRMEGAPEDVAHAATDAYARGWSLQETIYEERGGMLEIVRVVPRDPALFALDLDDAGAVAALRLEIPGETPVPLDPARFVIHRHRAEPTRPRGRSDLEAALPHYRAKRELAESWGLHLQRFASPTMVGRVGRGVSPAEQDALFAALRDLARNRVVVHPEEIAISSFGGDRAASAGFQEAIEFHNREIARAILGQTLVTDEGRRVGSLALGKVHLQVLLLQLTALRRELADRVLTEGVVRPLVELNFGPGPIPRWRFEEPKLEAFGA